MTDEAISPLRRRMIEDMTIRSQRQRPNKAISARSRILLRSSADRPTRRASRTSDAFNWIWRRTRAHPDSQSHRGGIAVLLRVTLRRPDIIEHTTFIHEPRKLPVVLSPEEVARLWMQRRG